MTTTITVESRQVGQKRQLSPQYSIPYHPQWQTSGGQTTLRDLIQHIVLEEVEAFRHRQEERRLFHALTAQEISTAVIVGKIDPGGHELIQDVSDDSAIAVALQAFEDGLYYVFLDNSQKTDLDATVYISPNSTVTFIRLVPLAGG